MRILDYKMLVNLVRFKVYFIKIIMITQYYVQSSIFRLCGVGLLGGVSGERGILYILPEWSGCDPPLGHLPPKVAHLLHDRSTA